MTIFSAVAIYYLVFLTLGVIAYGLAFVNPFLFDDTVIIQENEWLRWKYLPNFFRSFVNDSKFTFPGYRPLVFSTLTAQREWFGLSPWAFRAANLLIHVGVTCFVFWIARRVYKRFLGDTTSLWPLITALFFLLHPVQTNVITLVWKRSDLLVSLGILGTLYFYTKWNDEARPRFTYLVGAWLSTFVAFFSKESALILLFILILADVFLWFPKQTLKRRVLAIYLPTFLVTSIFAWIQFSILPKKLVEIGFEGQAYAPPSYLLGRWDYMKSQPIALLEYLKLVLAPIHLSVFHKIMPVHSFADLRFWIGIFIAASLLWIAIRSWKKYPILSFSICWFFLLLLPSSSFVPLFMNFDEDRLYLPLLGPALLFSYGLRLGIIKMKAWDWRVASKAFKAGAVLILVLYVTHDILRVRIWKSPYSLWGMNILDEPEDARAWLGLAMTFAANSNYDKADQAFIEATRLEPDYGVAYFFRGSNSVHLKKFEDAERCLTRAYQLNSFPDQSLSMSAVKATAIEDHAEAARLFMLALYRKPTDTTTLRNISMLLENQKEIDGALASLHAAYVLNPSEAETAYQMGLILWKYRHERKEAREFATLALKLKPEFEDARKLLTELD